MFPEAGIFLGDEGIDHVRRYFVQGHVTAVFDVDTAYFFAVAVIDNAGFFEIVDSFEIEFHSPLFVTFRDE